MKIEVERVGFGPGLLDLAEEWETLLRRSSRPTIYSSFDYVYTTCLHFKNEADIFFLLFRDSMDGRLLAIFPISQWLDTVFGIKLRCIGHGITAATTEVDKPYPIIDRDLEAVCWKRFSEYFQKDCRQWDRIVYNELWPGSGLYQQTDRLFPFPFYWTNSVPGQKSPIFELDGEWKTFWDTHHHCRTKNRRIEKELGDRLSFHFTCDPAEVDRCLMAYSATEAAGGKATAGIMGPEKLRFYQDLLPKLAAKGLLYFGMMYDGDTVVAVHVAYVYMDRVYFALCTFNPQYRRLSAGLVMHFRFIQFFYGKGYKLGDFLAGYAHYLNPWASYQEESVNLTIRRMGWRNGYVALRHLPGRVRARSRNADAMAGG